MSTSVEIRPSEAEKVPKYTERLNVVIRRSKKLGLEQALVEWAREITTRRLAWLDAWLEKNKDFSRLEGTEVRKGFQLILLEYMGISPDEVPIVEETETRITWRAHDFCPYLEATKSVELDTRDICRWATESPVQALLNAFNPKLRFSRNYEEIRPYSEYCEETIELID